MNNVKVIDSFLLTPKGFLLKKYHLQRTLFSLDQLEISINQFYVSQVYQKMEQLCLELEENYKVRLEINKDEPLSSPYEILKIEHLNLPIDLEVAKIPLTPEEQKFHQLKTTNRNYWNSELKTSHQGDVIGFNLNNEVTDTSRFNLFFKKDHIYLTPYLRSGCLNGVFRRFVLEHQRDPFTGNDLAVFESTIHISELPQYEVFVGNSVRGLLPARIY